MARKDTKLLEATRIWGPRDRVCMTATTIFSNPKVFLVTDDAILTNSFGTMSSTSQKHKNFVAEPMGDKPVSELAGIGNVLGERLSSKGFDKAYVVLGQYLILKKNKELFIDWIKDASGANAKQASDCYTCLTDWCEEFL